MTFIIDILQEVTVRAFLTALVWQKEPLPADLQQELNQVGQVCENNPIAAVNRLLELAKHPRLNALYHQARQDIQKLYEPQENNKYDKPEKQTQSEPNPPERLSNVAVTILKGANKHDNADNQTQPEPNPSERLINVAVTILKAPNSAEKAEEEKQQILLTSRQFML